MKLSFRQSHILQALKSFDLQTKPIDVFLNSYFRSHKCLGSKDRKEIAETIYTLIRWRGLIDYLLTPPCTWEKRLLTLPLDPLAYQKKEIPLTSRVSFPKCYLNTLLKSYDEKTVIELCLTLNEQAPLFLRANRKKISPEELVKRLEPLGALLRPSLAILLPKRMNVFLLPEFKEGLFEVQDEGSQIIASLVEAKPKDKVLDYCAGSGGKSLAIAHLLQDKGVLYLNDKRSFALQEAKKRFRRAGIQNVQFLSSCKDLQGKIDWLLLDVPCSGSGTLRRNPDMKWKFSEEMLFRLQKEQKKIFQEAFPLVKKNGFIVYATCSIFPEENEKQIEDFLSSYPLKIVKTFFTFPQRGGSDGFFGCVLSCN